jgi:hypothetical protein
LRWKATPKPVWTLLLQLACTRSPPPPVIVETVKERPSCASCHLEHSEALKSSIKASHQKAQVYEPVLALAKAASADSLCDGCHRPEGTSADAECRSCHGLKALGEKAVRGESGMVYGAKASAGCAYPVKEVPGFGSEQLCRSCHDRTHGQAGVFASWAGLEYAEQKISCSDCHMEKVGKQLAGHHFAVANEEWLSRSLDLSAKLQGKTLEVTAANGGAGHGVPPEACEYRELRVSVQFEGERGVALRRDEPAIFGCEIPGEPGKALFHFEGGPPKASSQLLPSKNQVWRITPPRKWKRAIVAYEYYRISPRFADRLPSAREQMKPVRFSDVEVHNTARRIGK